MTLGIPTHFRSAPDPPSTVATLFLGSQGSCTAFQWPSQTRWRLVFGFQLKLILDLGFRTLACSVRVDGLSYTELQKFESGGVAGSRRGHGVAAPLP